MSAPSDVARSPVKQVVAGTHRLIPEEETLQLLQPLLGRFGITRVANITGLDDIGIPTVVVTRPEARSLSVSQGKGLSLVAAKVSGIMESIEQYHAEHIQLPLWLGSYRERRQRSRVVDVLGLPRSARPFDPDERALWIEACSLGSTERMEVPLALVSLDLRLPLPPGSGFFPVGSNGLASGNGLLEAVTHGLWELIERDALALFYQRSTQSQARLRLRNATIQDPHAQALLARIERAGVGVALWDMTTDVGVPAIFCSIIERELDPFHAVGLARGFGCHPDRGVAVCRALCEAAQSRLTRIAGSRDDLQRDDFDAIRRPEHISRHQAQLNEPEQRDFRELPTRAHATFEEDVAWALCQLEAAGLGGVCFVDLSHQGVPIHVVRVIVPGLEGSPDVPGYQLGARALALRGGLG